MTAREYRNSFVRTKDRDARHRDPRMPSRRPMMTAREYRNMFVRTEDRDEDRDLMNQHGDPKRPVADSDVHQGTDIVQISSDDDEMLEYTPSTLKYTPSTPEYSPIVADYTPSTPSEDSTARFCPEDPSRSRTSLAFILCMLFILVLDCFNIFIR